jgi:sortase A
LPTPGPQAPTRIIIKKIKVDAPIVMGSGWEDLKKGVGHHPGTALPGMRGNMVLVAHDDVFGEIFRYLGDLEPGDLVTIYAGERAFNYVVKAKRIVEPTEISVMDTAHEPLATLITCYPYGIDTQRLVVIAELAP